MPRIITWVISLVLCQWALQVAGKKLASPSLVNKFLHYAELSSAAYASDCKIPPGGVKIVSRFGNPLTNTQGFIAKDEKANELVISLLATDNLPDILTDANVGKSVYKPTGGAVCLGCQVHNGFLGAWNSISEEVIGKVKDMLDDYDDDTKVILTGHSLGGALASLAAMSLIGSSINVTKYTFGQPRTGNRAYATFFDKHAPPGTMYRVTHSNDGVPKIFPTIIGYRHHSTEYWQKGGLLAAKKTYKCDGQEPRDCNDGTAGIPFINAAHLRYFGIPIGAPLDRGVKICRSKKLNGFQVAAGLIGFRRRG